ncbi:sensor histidine kinase [Desulfohalovibrio reitneri]|uniref:sensor histidine kinase n=1 Tax=Desulfohalovibrio reitneri TaxID=1307759 RepID=UPI0004A739BE|nr:histidine kinase dimerization/phospho-acceptor domain-containing protein [Desulfohalovibrio reitneri]
MSGDQEMVKTIGNFWEKTEPDEGQTNYSSVLLKRFCHDVRSPLCGVINMLELIKMNTQDKDRLHWLSLALRSSKEILTLVNDVGDVENLRQGRLQLRPQPFAPQEMVGELVRDATLKGAEKGVEVRLESKGLPPLVEGDRRRLADILEVLLDKALLTAEERVLLRVEAKPVKQNGKKRTRTYGFRFEAVDRRLLDEGVEEWLHFDPYTHMAEIMNPMSPKRDFSMVKACMLARMHEGELLVASPDGRGGGLLEVDLSAPRH